MLLLLEDFIIPKTQFYLSLFISIFDFPQNITLPCRPISQQPASPYHDDNFISLKIVDHQLGGGGGVSFSYFFATYISDSIHTFFALICLQLFALLYSLQFSW